MKEKLEKLSKKFDRWEIKHLKEGAGYMFTIPDELLFMDRCPERLVDKVIKHYGL